MNRALLILSTLLAALLLVAPASRVHAQEEEARLLFEQGNHHLARGMRSRGARRTRELQGALDAYLGVLRLGARTRNVVFNLALVLEELGRTPEAYNRYSQYLREFELSDEDRAAGQQRLDSLRPQVAVVSIESTPPGAEVRVDREDLPLRGTTPLELALPPEAHTLYFGLAGFEPTTAAVTVAIGQTARVSVTLTGLPVAVQFIAPRGRLLLDGEPIEAGRAVPVAPGSHTVRLEVPGSVAVERSFEVQPGSAPMAIHLSAEAPAEGEVQLALDVDGQVSLDGIAVGGGRRVRLSALTGEHVLRIEAPGYNRLEHPFTMETGQSLSFSAHLGQHVEAGGLDVGRAVMVGLTIAGAIGASLMTAHAYDLRAQWDTGIEPPTNNGPQEQALEQLADRLEGAALGADLLWGLTIAAGTIGVVLFIVDPGTESESTIELVAEPVARGGALSARGTF